MNKGFFIGNLTKDPETRSFPSGDQVCNFTLAIDRKTRDGQKMTDYVRVSAYRQLGENCGKFLAKGRKAAVVGRMTASAYTDREGKPRAQLEVIAEEVEFLSAKSEGEAPTQAAPAEDRRTGYAVIEDEELPF